MNNEHPMSFERNGAGICAAALFLLAAGCGTLSSRPAEMLIAMTPDGRFIVDGRVVGLEQLPQSVASAGASSRTRIKVSIMAHTRMEQVAEIARALTLAGYRNILFVKPRQSKSFAGSSQKPTSRAAPPARR